MQPPASGVVTAPDGVSRCWWCAGDPLYESYHDEEWGRPVADDRRLFEKLCLEGFMSGLSWLTILRKRESFRRAFAGFDFETVASFGRPDVERLVTDASIVRHRGKIEATVNNAARCIELVEECGSLAAYAWSFEPPARPAPADWDSLAAITTVPEAKAMSKDLKRRGWSFVGPTTVYSFMESMGLVDDHMAGCTLRADVEAERARFVRPG